MTSHEKLLYIVASFSNKFHHAFEVLFGGRAEHGWSMSLKILRERAILLIHLLIPHVLRPVKEGGHAHPMNKAILGDYAHDLFLKSGHVVVFGQAHDLMKFFHTVPKHLISLVTIKGLELIGVKIAHQLAKRARVMGQKLNDLLLCLTALALGCPYLVKKPRRFAEMVLVNKVSLTYVTKLNVIASGREFPSERIRTRLGKEVSI